MTQTPPPMPRPLLVLSTDGERLEWLRAALSVSATVVAVAAEQGEILEQISHVGARLLVADFESGEQLGPLLRAALAAYPDLTVLGLGKASNQRAVLAAMRAHAVDFLNLEGPPEEAAAIVSRIQARAWDQRTRRHGRLVVLLAGRPGAGASTLAATLGALLQRRGPKQDALLLDFGFPVGDGAVYLGIPAKLTFTEGVRNLARCDRTYLQAAIARHSSGLGLLPLFTDVRDLRTVKPADAYQFLGLLLSTYDLVIADLGAASIGEVGAYLLREADRVLLLSEQSVAGMMAAQRIAAVVQEKVGPTERNAMVVGRHDAQLGITPDYLADAVRMPLYGILPERRRPLLDAMNGGRLITDAAPRDPYVRAASRMAGRLAGELWGSEVPAAAPKSAWAAIWPWGGHKI